MNLMKNFSLRSCFNPRVLAGGRDIRSMRLPKVLLFQSTRPRGRTRRHTATSCVFGGLFQSTRPRGRTRRTAFERYRTDTCFNPRVLAGGRDDIPDAGDGHQEFQSTRPRGRTRHQTGDRINRHRTFQSTRPRGRTRPTLFQTSFSCHRFQSTRPRGRTRRSLIKFTIFATMFQSTRPRGRTRQRSTKHKSPHLVSIHASSREDATGAPT